MFINFNKEKLDELLMDFHSLTGLATSVWDAQMNLISFQPRDMCTFCTLIKTTDEGRKRCRESDKAVCMKSAKTLKTVTHRCHAGLADTAVPIKYKDEIMGFVVCGQVVEESAQDIQVKIEELSRQLKIDREELQIAHSQLLRFDKSKLISAANILENIAEHLWLSEYIDVGYNTIASQLDDYIRENLSDDLSVNGLCRRFGISKNRLYEISRKWFKKSVLEYITSVRIEEAKKLLTTTDLPINQISAMVGIKDYNYFTKVFKAYMGTPPLKYRKSFPFSL
ncbi:MAG: PocR ligand-binding domain-containing protein [Acutalibacteraceae bacterium]|nr:PocR ligand-binding domain-containing protein [Acutalibacteraceae bacterium]